MKRLRIGICEDDPVQLKYLKQEVESYYRKFRNVSFHYPNNDELVLKNITTKIRVGRKMAIVGKNGSGKSTFIKLLCRLYGPTEGEILLNGIDIKKYDYDEKTAIYISHRMSSCRFCENIIVFEDGNIAQMGNHDTLVSQDGLYRELWNAQAQYYQK